MVGENGGSIFILIYLFCAFFIGVPILMAEIMIGRRGAAPPELAMQNVAIESTSSPNWSAVGYLSLVTAFLFTIVYSVVAGWVLYYFSQSLISGFSGTDLVLQVGSFENLQSDFSSMVLWSLVALAITASILVLGVQKGIERVVSLLIPLLVGLLILLVLFNAVNGGMKEALQYMFFPDLEAIHSGIFLAAVSQAFFSIGVGLGAMMIFGSYLPSNISIGKSAVLIVSADTLIALLAGLVIFPLVFNNGLQPDSGTGLIFDTLPIAFAQIPLGSAVGGLFFLLLSMAAITSMLGGIEPLVAFVMRRFRSTRLMAVLLVSSTCFLFSILSAVSMSSWSELSFYGRLLSDWLDFIPNSVFLPLGGLLICVFAGWSMQEKHSKEELSLDSVNAYMFWRVTMKWAVAPAVFVILITGVLA